MTRTEARVSLGGEEPVEKGKVVINRVSFHSFFMILPRLKVVWAGDRRRDSISVGRGNISNGAWLNPEFRDRDISDLGVSRELELQNN
jgi:hypothetical protein